MKKNVVELMKVGILIPALVLSLAACGNSGSTNGNSAETPAAEEEAEAETKADADAAAQEDASGAEEEAQQEPAEEIVYENGGYKLTVPAEFSNKVIVKVPENSEDEVLFDVYEKASVEAAKAAGEDEDIMGWLFSICKRDEDTFHDMLASDMSGENPLGSDGNGTYFVMYHPTDVRYYRESPEKMEEDQDEWTAACEWGTSVRKTFVEENGLTVFHWSNTVLEAYLARAAYGFFGEDVPYTISTTEFGPLEPNGVDAVKYFEQLTSDATYESVDAEAPDGEYVVLNFPEDDVRFDFFLAEGGENLIRQVWGDYEEIYQVTFEDDSKKASAIMQEWYNELAANR